MADEDKSSKTEEPTAKRLAEAHKRGQFAKSPDLGTAAVLIGALLAVSISWRGWARDIGSMARGILGHLGEYELTLANTAEGARHGFAFMSGIQAPLMVACMAGVIIVGGLQSGFKLTPKVLEMDANKLNPLKGFKRVFSMKQLVQAGMDLLKFVAVAAILYGAVVEIMDDPIFFSPVAFSYMTDFLLSAGALMFLRLIAAIGVLAILHYLYQIKRTRKDLMMSKQEIKDERKQAEGDPKVKAAMRAAAMRNLQQQMLSDVQTADVVVTNPTHFAVALKYERGQDSAPVVLAKGEGAFARRIKAIAAEYGVPMVENKPVARLLYRVGKVGESIPVELYEVVARILAHVYKTHKYYFYRLKTRRSLAKEAAE